LLQRTHPSSCCCCCWGGARSLHTNWWSLGPHFLTRSLVLTQVQAVFRYGRLLRLVESDVMVVVFYSGHDEMTGLSNFDLPTLALLIPRSTLIQSTVRT
jgi:hypothetical protein